MKSGCGSCSTPTSTPKLVGEGGDLQRPLIVACGADAIDALPPGIMGSQSSTASSSSTWHRPRTSFRGSVDQADFKAYIFPLMFFKRISDVYLEEYAQALGESGGDHEFARARAVLCSPATTG